MNAWCPAVLAVLVVGACAREPKIPPKVPRPANVLAVVSVPSWERAAADVTGYAEQLGRAEHARVRAQLGELERELGDAVDRGKPLHAVVMAPGGDGGEPALVLVAPIVDAAKLRAALPAGKVVEQAGGWAAVGGPAAVAGAWPWARTALIGGPAPVRARATLYPAGLAAWTRADLEALAAAPSAGRALAGEVALAFVEQCERVEAQVTFAEALATIDVTVVPRPGTTLAAVLAAQRPSTFALFERLPLENPFGTFAGTVALGPLAPRVRALVTSVIAEEVGTVAPPLQALLDELWAAATGEFGGVTTASGGVINAFGVRDAAAVRDELAALADAVAALRGPTGAHFVARSLGEHGGVQVTAGTMAGPDVPTDVPRWSWATWDDVLALSINGEHAGALRAAIDGSRAPRPPGIPPLMRGILDEARRRGDSMIQSYDVLLDGKAAIVVGFGVRAGAGYLWISLPAAHLAAVNGAATAAP